MKMQLNGYMVRLVDGCLPCSRGQISFKHRSKRILACDSGCHSPTLLSTFCGIHFVVDETTPTFEQRKNEKHQFDSELGYIYTYNAPAQRVGRSPSTTPFLRR